MRTSAPDAAAVTRAWLIAAVLIAVIVVDALFVLVMVLR